MPTQQRSQDGQVPPPQAQFGATNSSVQLPAISAEAGIARPRNHSREMEAAEPKNIRASLVSLKEGLQTLMLQADAVKGVLEDKQQQISENRAQALANVDDRCNTLVNAAKDQQSFISARISRWKAAKETSIQNVESQIAVWQSDLKEKIDHLKSLEQSDDKNLLVKYFECSLSAPRKCPELDGSHLQVPDVDGMMSDACEAAKAAIEGISLEETNVIAPMTSTSSNRRLSAISADSTLMTDQAELERVSLVCLPSFNVQSLSADDKRLLWRHRVTLTENPRALLKLFHCIDWEDKRQVKGLLTLVPSWVDLEIDDALELLGEGYVVDPVRSLAVRSLASKVSNETLSSLLLSLVQAMHHDVSEYSDLVNFVMSRCLKDCKLAMAFYWQLSVEKTAGQFARYYLSVFNRLCKEIAEKNIVFSPSHNFHNANNTLDTTGQVPILKRQGSRDSSDTLADVLRRQELFVAACQNVAHETKRFRENRLKQVERLRGLLSGGGSFGYLSSFATPIRLPHQPDVLVTGVLAEQSNVLNSAMYPLKFILRTVDGNAHPVLLKSSSDLRRDQLVLSTINLMDTLLKEQGLDLRITTYSVTATSLDCGLVEFVNSTAVARVLADYGNDIRQYFSKHAPSDKHPSGIDPEVLDTFVRSCAGFCVISFLLGIGDRHLDNLMLTTQGHLFHVDFEYILGNDPKPFAPQMKLSEQMVVAMGGRGSQEYLHFQRLCCKAFLVLRKNARLIVNLFELVTDSNIFDTKAKMQSPATKLLERFQLHLSKEEAVMYMQTVIQDSLGAFFPVVVDTIHKWRQYFR